MANVIVLVKKTHNWANLPPLSETDLAERAKDWQDELEKEIPLNRLADALSQARKNHTSSFPINLYEISTAYRALVNAELEDRKAIKAKNPILFCEDRRYHLNNIGDVIIFSLFTTTDERVPCRKCRFEDYENWRKSQVALYGEVQPLTKLCGTTFCEKEKEKEKNNETMGKRNETEILLISRRGGGY